jgi:hypothetical protein
MKILYGVPGEGMGHATRSKVVIDYLFQKAMRLKLWRAIGLINF